MEKTRTLNLTERQANMLDRALGAALRQLDSDAKAGALVDQYVKREESDILAVMGAVQQMQRDFIKAPRNDGIEILKVIRD